MKQVTMKLKELAYIYKKQLSLDQLQSTVVPALGMPYPLRLMQPSRALPASIPCRNSRSTSPAMRSYPPVGDQCPHRRYERACAQNSLHLLQCQAGWLNSDSCLCKLSQHLYLTGDLTNMSDVVMYLAKVQFVLAWFALVYWKHHPPSTCPPKTTLCCCSFLLPLR